MRSWISVIESKEDLQRIQPYEGDPSFFEVGATVDLATTVLFLFYLLEFRKKKVWRGEGAIWHENVTRASLIAYQGCFRFDRKWGVGASRVPVTALLLRLPLWRPLWQSQRTMTVTSPPLRPSSAGNTSWSIFPLDSFGLHDFDDATQIQFNPTLFFFFFSLFF